MGQKDIAEKRLEMFNDVFSNLGNFALFKGQNIIKPEELSEISPELQSREDEKLTEPCRDIIKVWRNCGIQIAFLGIENQSAIDPSMVLRVMHYDVLTYLKQLQAGKKIGELLPVKTIVVYFGRKPWTTGNSLSEICNIPEQLAACFTILK